MKFHNVLLIYRDCIIEEEVTSFLEAKKLTSRDLNRRVTFID